MMDYSKQSLVLVTTLGLTVLALAGVSTAPTDPAAPQGAVAPQGTVVPQSAPAPPGAPAAPRQRVKPSDTPHLGLFFTDQAVGYIQPCG